MLLTWFMQCGFMGMQKFTPQKEATASWKWSVGTFWNTKKDQLSGEKKTHKNKEAGVKKWSKGDNV